MRLIKILSTIAVVLAISACATKPAPHKLTAPAPGDNSAPSASSW